MKILWFASTIEDTNFIIEFRKHFTETIDIFHINFITLTHLFFHPGKALLPTFRKEAKKIPTSDTTATCFNTLSKRLTPHESKRAYQATRNQLEKYCKKNNKEELIFVIPSGRHIHHVAARDIAESLKIRCIYINYSNFPGYTFFDPHGTDCQSKIYHDPDLLDREYPRKSKDQIQDIFHKFSSIKSTQKRIPQASSSTFKLTAKKTAFLIDTLLQKITGVYGDRRERLSLTREAKAPQPAPAIVPQQTPFIFFPLQVSTDQQVLVNYQGGSIFSAIDEAIHKAKEIGNPLIVREHPAESMKSLVRDYLQKKENGGYLKISSAPVSELIKHCTTIITINSTVGLEARINNKPVIFIGKSFYKIATDEQLATYLNDYLIEIDYHKPVASKNIVKKIIDFAGTR